MRPLLFYTILACTAAACAGPMHVVASIPDLAAIATEIGGETVRTESICRSDQDPHSVEILPQHLLTMKDAVVYLKVGAGLDNWADQLIQAGGKPGLKVVDCSSPITLLQTGHDDAPHGDLHSAGNPHYWLAPSNLLPLATVIAQALIEKNRYSSSYYRDNLMDFAATADSMMVVWRGVLGSCSGRGLVSYHSTWDYFAHDFGIPVIATIESRPGQEPAPRDLAETLQKILAKPVIAILREPQSPQSLCEMVSKESGIPVLTVASLNSGTESGAVWRFFDSLAQQLAELCHE